MRQNSCSWHALHVWICFYETNLDWKMCNCGEKCKINCTYSPNLYLELVYHSGPRPTPRLLYLALGKWAHIAQILSFLYLHFFSSSVKSGQRWKYGRGCEIKLYANSIFLIRIHLSALWVLLGFRLYILECHTWGTDSGESRKISSFSQRGGLTRRNQQCVFVCVGIN